MAFMARHFVTSEIKVSEESGITPGLFCVCEHLVAKRALRAS